MRDGLLLEIFLLLGRRGSDYVADNTYHERGQLAIFTFQAVCEWSDILPEIYCTTKG